MREQQRVAPDPRRSQGRLRAGVTTPNDDHIELSGEVHALERNTGAIRVREFYGQSSAENRCFTWNIDEGDTRPRRTARGTPQGQHHDGEKRLLACNGA